MYVAARSDRDQREGITAFGYGKPQNFSGYVCEYPWGLSETPVKLTGYIFDTTSKYIKVPSTAKNAEYFFK